MSESVKQSVTDVLQSPRIAGSVSGSTVAVGLAETFQLIPWGSVAAATGAVLSAVMIVVQVWKFWIERKGDRLARQIQHLQIEALKEKADRRRAEGQPLRRGEDATYSPSTQTGDEPTPPVTQLGPLSI